MRIYESTPCTSQQEVAPLAHRAASDIGGNTTASDTTISHQAATPQTTPPASDTEFDDPPISVIGDQEWRLDENDFNAKFWVDPDWRINLELVNNTPGAIDGDCSPLPPYPAALNQQDFNEPPPYGSEDSLEQSDQIPRMNVVMHAVGSREEISYFIDLGGVLQKIYGHRVRIATHADFRADVESYGIEFFDIGIRPLALGMFMVKPTPGSNGHESRAVLQRKTIAWKVMNACWRSCVDFSPDRRTFVADAIIANPQSLAHVHCAEKLGVPLHLILPTTPTRDFPHPLVNLTNVDLEPQLANSLSYSIIELLLSTTLGPMVNKFREETLKLELMRNTFGIPFAHNIGCPITYFRSQLLFSKPGDWPHHIHVLPKIDDVGNHPSVDPSRDSEIQAAAQDFLCRLRLDRPRCAMLDSKIAVWNARMPKNKSKTASVPLSAAAATWLQERGVLRQQDIELFRAREYDLADYASDPISSLLSNTWHTTIDILQGAAAGPIEAYKRVQANNRSNECNAWDGQKSGEEDSALTAIPISAAKGIGQIVVTGLKTPAIFTHGLAQGFNNVPTMYGDKTVRDRERVSDIKSGVISAGKGLGHGLFDGVTGFFVQPVTGAKEEGAVGFLKGFGKGLGGLVCKPAAGACGVPGYAFMGVYRQIQNAWKASADEDILEGRIKQGEHECMMLTESEKEDIVRRLGEYCSTRIA
ncbi:hypothetical protein F4677DRAFT_462800 [Hypoxylon crocopeplum]|nr:hypothetical protein F4677DRAFT_462800 [Hypoxylon crocopeplum]